MDRLPNEIQEAIDYIKDMYSCDGISVGELERQIKEHLWPYLSLQNKPFNKDWLNRVDKMIKKPQVNVIAWIVNEVFFNEIVWLDIEWCRKLLIKRLNEWLHKVELETVEQPQIEKIERSLCELTTTGSSHTKYTRDIEWTISKLIEAVNLLISKW